MSRKEKFLLWLALVGLAALVLAFIVLSLEPAVGQAPMLPPTLTNSMVYLRSGDQDRIPGWFWITQADPNNPNAAPPIQGSTPGRWVYVTTNDTGSLTIPGWFSMVQPDPPPPVPAPEPLPAPEVQGSEIILRTWGNPNTTGRQLQMTLEVLLDGSGVTLLGLAVDGTSRITKIEFQSGSNTFNGGGKIIGEACLMPLPPDHGCNVFWPYASMVAGNNDFNMIATNALNQRFFVVGKVSRPVRP